MTDAKNPAAGLSSPPSPPREDAALDPIALRPIVSNGLLNDCSAAGLACRRVARRFSPHGFASRDFPRFAFFQQPGWPARAPRGFSPHGFASPGFPRFAKRKWRIYASLCGPASPPGPPASISAPPFRARSAALSCRKRQDKTGVLLFRPQFGRAFRIGRQAAASIARRIDRVLPDLSLIHISEPTRR